ncbi:hypothetical protein MKX73_17115 [Solibacillus sp. FSL W7-1436]|uniref:hypothetical protein n=1 Tax=Solibacillus sp. FSL W7-1436 TaxID=2921705 RepID=UPI0030F97E87
MKSYIFKQFTCILVLILFAFIADYYLQNVNVAIESVALKQVIMFIAISILLFVCNQLIYNYAKKEEGFMQHKVWNKMFIVILVCLMLSFVIFIVLFFATPLEELITSFTWIMFIVAYYFIFFTNLFVLSIVHNVVDRSMKVEKKILITWTSSSLLVAIILFVLPSF